MGRACDKLGASFMHPVFSALTRNYPDLASCQNDIESAATILENCYANGGKLLVCGNGGSAADSEHLVAELMKGFILKRALSSADSARFAAQFGDEGAALAAQLEGALPAIALTGHTSLSTAVANDGAPHAMFAQQVWGYGQPNDVLLAITTSGNSVNVINALRVAKVKGLKTIGLTGASGGAMKALCDVTICVPCEITHEIQERHLPIYHAWAIALEARFFGNQVS